MTKTTSKLPATPGAAEAEELLLDIIAVRGGVFQGKTLLYKAFYLAHLYYWQSQAAVLTHYPVVAMPNGPGLDDGDALIAGLERAGRLTRESDAYGPYKTEVFTLLESRTINPTDPRQDAIRAALDFIGNKTARQVCDEIHEFSISWKRASSGDELPIYLDVLSGEDITAARVAAKETDALFREAFGEGT